MDNRFNGLGFTNKPKKTFLSMLVFGENFTGKSTIGLSFPQPNVIDIENGMQFLKKKSFVPWQTTDFSYLQSHDPREILEKLTTIVKTLEGNIEDITLVIDSSTKLWELIQTQYAEGNNSGNALFGSKRILIHEWTNIKRRLKSTMLKLSSANFHKVHIAHAGDVFEKKPNGDMVVVGTRSKSEKSMIYDMDIIIELITPEDKRNKKNLPFCCIIHKDRTQVYAKNDIVENPRYELWKKFVDSGVEINRDEPKPTIDTVARPNYHDDIINCLGDPEIQDLMDKVGIGKMGEGDVEKTMRYKACLKYKGNAIVIKQQLKMKLGEEECPI